MGTILKVLLAVVALGIAFQLRGLILIVLTSVVIASIVEPGTRWFVRKNIPRALAAALVYFIIVLGIISIASFVIPPLFSETLAALNSLPKYVKTIDLFSGTTSAFLGFKTLFPDLPSTISIGNVIGIFTDTISSFSGGVFDTVASFFGGIISIILVAVISFYLSVREDGVADFLAVITPVQYERYVRNLWKRTQMKIARWMQGQIILALFVGIATYIGLLAAGVSHPFLLAFVAAVFELIPVIGLTLSLIPAFLFALLDGGVGLALIVLAIYIIIQQIEAHAIYPLVVKRIVGVPPLLVIIALVAGAELAGFVGAILAVPLSVVLMEFIEDAERRKKMQMLATEEK